MWTILVFIASSICCVHGWSIPKPPPSSKKISTRNDFIHQFTSSATLLLTSSIPQLANAAPPFAIMQEELGYFPIKDDNGETYMVPSKIKRTSTDQAISLAKYLSSSNNKGKRGATMYGAYWCPHCQRQKELFGYEAFQYINYIECSPKGYKNDFGMCINDGIEGYPYWKFDMNGSSQSGEMELIDIAKKSGYKGKFDDELEKVNGVPPIGGGACAE